MSFEEAKVQEIKASIASLTAGPPIVSALQSLLGPATKTTPANRPKTQQSTRKLPRAGASAKSGSRRAATTGTVQIHEDVSPLLSDKAKYALATELSSLALKVLSGKFSKSAALPNEKIPTSTASREALQSRSSNATSSPGSKRISSVSLAAAPSQEPVQCIGKCASLSLSFLASSDPAKIGIRPLPKLQLESAIVALAGRFLSLGLYVQAEKEIRILRKRLAAFESRLDSDKLPGRGSAPEKSLADLFDVHIDLERHSDTVPIVVSYHLHLLQLIAANRKSTDVEELSRQLAVETDWSPGNLIVRRSLQLGKPEWAAKQLESWARILSSLSSDLSQADHIETGAVSTVSPSTAFRLQVAALKFRQKWWGLVSHEPDESKDLLVPFEKALSALSRCAVGAEGGDNLYTVAKTAYQELGLNAGSNSDGIFQVHRSLLLLASQTSKKDDIDHWFRSIARYTGGLEISHALSAVVAIRKVLIHLSGHEGEYDELNQSLSAVKAVLEDKITGQRAHYDLLLSEMALLLQALRGRTGGDKFPALHRSIEQLSAEFAQRYHRAYPGRNGGLLIAVVLPVLTQSPDTAVHWITVDSPGIIVRSGVLEKITAKTLDQSFGTAWSINSLAVALDLSLATLIRRCLSSNSSSTARVFDDPTLPRLHRAAVLERQLVHLSETASGLGCHKGAEFFIQTIVQILRELYGVDKHPLRLARVEILVRRLNASIPSLDMAFLGDFDALPDKLFDDAPLGCFRDDLMAGLGMCRAFSTKPPLAADVKPYLVKWQHILDSCANSSALARRIHDQKVLRSILTSAARYFGALGEVRTRILILRMLLQLAKINVSNNDQCAYLIQLAHESLQSNLFEAAGRFLMQFDQTSQGEQVPAMTVIRFKMTKARYYLAINNLPKARTMLEEAADLRGQQSHKTISRRERREFFILHAQAWFLYSKYLFATSAPHESLIAARRSVKVLNSLWSASERSIPTGDKTRKAHSLEDSTLEVDKVVDGVSKLRLTSKHSDEQKPETFNSWRGSASWDLVPLLHDALLQLSDVYAHHGLFPEADNFSRRALDISASMRNGQLSIRCQIHRAMLLTQAGRVSDAELCLEKIETATVDEDPSLAIDLELARAQLLTEENSYEAALVAYCLAEDMVRAMFEAVDDLLLPDAVRCESTKVPARQAKSKTGPTRTTGSTTRSKIHGTTKSKSSAATQPDTTPETPHLIQRYQVKIALAKAALAIRGSKDPSSDFEILEPRCLGQEEIHQHRELLFESMLKGAFDNVTSDFALSALLDSSIAYPVVFHNNSKGLTDGDNMGSFTEAAATRTKRDRKANAPSASVASVLNTELNAARKLLLEGHTSSYCHRATSSVYQECGSLSRVTMFAAATAQSVETATHPTTSGLYIDLPRIYAATCGSRASSDRASGPEEASQWEWPDVMDVPSNRLLSAASFQAKYIDILPECWTAVSMCLNTRGDELLVARYRQGLPPLTLRLPFSRNRDDVDGDDPDVDVFDYFNGKAELQDIIQQSNVSCHSSVDTEKAGAKSKWWNERQALDLRLQELLTNIEHIWLGGFRGVLSTHSRQSQPFCRFRKSLDDILFRHLPSRSNDKAGIKPLTLDDQVLELFIGLGSNEDDNVDLDDAITDLLYFIVDMLLFGGERNAYDEIDFDRMTVEVGDALTSYYEGCNEAKSGRPHLVLILEKRLQAFPWESLSCLQGVSVSRVGSMQMLKECLAARDARADATNADHVVDRTSGSYILNPSTDLVSTQTTLEPALLRMSGDDDDEWTSIVRRAPSEDEFGSALSTSKILLYFGHGAGSQYIKGRTIRKLESCSEVVWLMGCSSGAVTEYGQFEPTAVPLTYLQAGRSYDATGYDSGSSKCMAVLATLWDVTDKDIDRFSLSVGEEWGLWPSMEASKLSSKTQRRRQVETDPMTPKRPLKTPKTPKVHKTPTVAKTPSRSRDRSRTGQKEGQRGSNLTQAVADSREACFLRYLNGAAPVVYGVPVLLSDGGKVA